SLSLKDGHAADSTPSSSTPPRPSPGPKLQVQRSLSRDTITIHFSALGQEEDEDEELYGFGASVSLSPAGEESEGLGGMGGRTEDQGIVTALEASEELLFDAGGIGTTTTIAVSSTTLPHSPALPILPSSMHSPLQSPPACSSWPSDHTRPTIPPTSSSTTSSPSRSAALPSKPFLSLRSLSNEMMVAPPSSAGRHRHHLMKTFVKSLSTDNTRPDHQEAPSPPSLSQQRPPPDSRVNNLQLFKQLGQPMGSTTFGGGDSKTAPSSPLTSPADGRCFFKVQEMEARIEDTRRRLSEVMCEPMHLFSKFMGDASATHRSLSLSATELTNLAGLNGHAESNKNYSIKEEGGNSEGEEEEEEEEETPTGEASADSVFSSPPAKSSRTSRVSSPPPLPRSSSLALGHCSMSVLVRLEDEEFCELYSEDFELCTDTETPDGERPGSLQIQTGSTGVCSEAESDEEEEDLPNVPITGLLFFTCLVYSYLVFPLPPYLCAVVQGVAAGFMLAILVVWLSAPEVSSCSGTRQGRRRGEQWNVAQLDIKEPGIFKGWMNQMSSYDLEMYHATLTHSVYVRLEGSTLRLSKPNRNIARRATHNEPKPDVTYISQKIYDLTDSKIHLVPQSLARKRVWNKKYPICIELAKQEDFMSKVQAQGERPDPGEEKPAGSRKPPGERDLTLFLFGRTGREKEEWFRRILVASRLKSEANKTSSECGCHCLTDWPHRLEAESRSSSRGSLMDEPSQKDPSLAGGVRQKMLLDYNVYMAKYVTPLPPLDSPPRPASPSHSPEGSPGATKKLPSSPCERPGRGAVPEAWVNALIGRVFWDFLGEKYWADMVSKKIQMKLSKIRLPYFMNELALTALDMGFSIPKILHASKPSVDHQGLWFDLEVSYTGSFIMTLETKMNLARLGKEGEGLGEQGKEGPRPRAYCLADSDEESSSAGSSDEEDPPEIPMDMVGAEGMYHTPLKIMRFVDKIAKSKYFQKATETEFIKKKIEGGCPTALLLTVEVLQCRGMLAVTYHPPPTDRIGTYGFRSPPQLELKARPKLGEREVTLAHVTDWIEKKLDQEFQFSCFVLTENICDAKHDDLWLPIMHSAMDNPF
uniref:Testis expressed 2 n=1 Tax=Salmo trutta TaxID=8032 RepID=A0A673W621_SALTR